MIIESKKKNEKYLNIKLMSVLNKSTQEFLYKIGRQFRLSFQEMRDLIEIARDLVMWKQMDIYELWNETALQVIEEYPRADTIQIKQKILKIITKYYENIKQIPVDYGEFNIGHVRDRTYKINPATNKKKIIGSCPVYSDKTRCCNLRTIDAVESCYFDCSYCSIQTFYTENQIGVHKNIAEILSGLEIDADKIYHFGTGQASDSLLFGNRHGVLTALSDFARINTNVIIELKTKSKNIDYFLEYDVPRNIICTWSINPPLVIDNEEHFTASYHERLQAARKVADRGNLVGFHLHPIFYLKDFEMSYTKIVNDLTMLFRPEEVAMISMGTLTFTKNVMNKIRSRDQLNSMVLKFPTEEIAGKFSYPLTVKEYMFKTIYDAFATWHSKVYFYLCMEDDTLWPKVFNKQYQTNQEFEVDMLSNYMSKIRQVKMQDAT